MRIQPSIARGGPIRRLARRVCAGALAVVLPGALAVVLPGALAGALFSCGPDAPKPKPPAGFPAKVAAIPGRAVAAESNTSPATSTATSNATLIELPSITLPKPASWMWVKPTTAFRTLQYQVFERGRQDATPAEPSADLIVSVFKLGDGGSVQANIERWKNQFQGADGTPPEPELSRRVVAGVPVTRADLKGSWKGMGMEQERKNTRQLAAAIELPTETIYIRLVGPENIVESARVDFEAMVDGLAPRAK